MPLTKSELKKIAFKAWEDCFNNLGYSHSYVVTIQGDSDKIYAILTDFAQEVNNRHQNQDYTVHVENTNNQFEFLIWENEKLTPCYEFDEDEEETEIVADSAVFVESNNPAPEDKIWNKIRERLLTPSDGEFFVHDELAIALNYGNCLSEGRHEKTSDEDWELFLKVTIAYDDWSQDHCYEIYKRLDAERLELLTY